MSLTLETMRDLVRSRLDDEDFEQEFLDQSLAEAQWDLLRNKNLTLTESTNVQTLNSGDSSLDLPADFSSIIGLTIKPTDGELRDITDKFVDFATYQRNLQNSNTNTQVPEQWTTFDGKILFPNDADQNYTVTLYYFIVPTRPALDEDVFIIPDQYQELLKLAAYIRIAKREDDYEVRDAEQQDYLRLLDDFLKTYRRNPSPRRVRIMGTRRR